MDQLGTRYESVIFSLFEQASFYYLSLFSLYASNSYLIFLPSDFGFGASQGVPEFFRFYYRNRTSFGLIIYRKQRKWVG